MVPNCCNSIFFRNGYGNGRNFNKVPTVQVLSNRVPLDKDKPPGDGGFRRDFPSKLFFFGSKYIVQCRMALRITEKVSEYIPFYYTPQRFDHIGWNFLLS